MQGLANLLIDNDLFDKAFDQGVRQTAVSSNNGDLNGNLDFNQLMTNNVNTTGGS